MLDTRPLGIKRTPKVSSRNSNQDKLHDVVPFLTVDAHKTDFPDETRKRVYDFTFDVNGEKWKYLMYTHE